jgi:secreted trypsin-like serine protease
LSQGDSGGPLVIDVNEGRQSGFEKSCRFMQVGIVSWGKGKLTLVAYDSNYNTVYTRIIRKSFI